MPKPKAKSLDEFAAAMPKAGSRAWLAQVPELAEIVAAYRNGIGPRVIYEWLKQEKGYSDVDLHGYSSFRAALRDQSTQA